MQGIDFGAILNLLYQWADPPSEFSGNVVSNDAEYNVLLKWHQSHNFASNDLFLSSEHHATRESAALSTASKIFYVLIANGEPGFEKKLTCPEFEILVRALREYSLCATIVNEEREDSVVSAQESLERARNLTDVLLRRGVGDRYPTISKLADQIEKTPLTGRMARISRTNQIVDVLKGGGLSQAPFAPVPFDGAKVPSDPTGAGTVGVVSQARMIKDSRQRIRPVQPGTSVSSAESSAGTLCCIVKRKADPKTRYILSANHVFTGIAGTPILQPAQFDGGDLDRDVIGEIDNATPGDGYMTAVLAKLDDTTQVVPECFMLGAFTGIGDVELGGDITLVGRTSGVSKGKVVAINVKTTIAIDHTGRTVELDDLVSCQTIAGKPMSRAGDSGSPVVNKKNELVGMIYAGSDTVSLFVPIKPILERLGVELVTKNDLP